MIYLFERVRVEAPSFEAALDHVKKNHPDVYQRYLDGMIPTLEDQTPVDSDEIIKSGLLRIMLVDRFELENRIRVLEGSPTITVEQFKAAIKTRLGL